MGISPKFLLATLVICVGIAACSDQSGQMARRYDLEQRFLKTDHVEACADQILADLVRELGDDFIRSQDISRDYVRDSCSCAKESVEYTLDQADITNPAMRKIILGTALVPENVTFIFGSSDDADFNEQLKMFFESQGVSWPILHQAYESAATKIVGLDDVIALGGTLFPACEIANRNNLQRYPASSPQESDALRTHLWALQRLEFDPQISTARMEVLFLTDNPGLVCEDILKKASSVMQTPADMDLVQLDVACKAVFPKLDAELADASLIARKRMRNIYAVMMYHSILRTSSHEDDYSNFVGNWLNYLPESEVSALQALDAANPWDDTEFRSEMFSDFHKAFSACVADTT